MKTQYAAILDTDNNPIELVIAQNQDGNQVPDDLIKLKIKEHYPERTIGKIHRFDPKAAHPKFFMDDPEIINHVNKSQVLLDAFLKSIDEEAQPFRIQFAIISRIDDEKIRHSFADIMFRHKASLAYGLGKHSEVNKSTIYIFMVMGMEMSCIHYLCDQIGITINELLQ